MDVLCSYTSSSSSDDDEQCSDRKVATHPSNNKQPPPFDTTSTSPNLLPPVIPLRTTRPLDRYRLHVSIMLSHTSLPTFIRTLLSLTRLRMLNQPLKAPLTPASDNLHISLSRPTIITSDAIRPTLNAVKTSIFHVSSGSVTLSPSVAAFLNESGRRVYFAAPVASSSESAHSVANLSLTLIEAINKAFHTLKLPPHFDDPRPHMSFAFTEAIDILPIFNSPDPTSSHLPTTRESLTIPVDTVTCTIGKSRYNFTLRPADL